MQSIDFPGNRVEAYRPVTRIIMMIIINDKYFTKVIVADANNTNFTKLFATTLRV